MNNHHSIERSNNMNFLARIFFVFAFCSSLVFASVNPTNDTMLTLSAKDQAETMAAAVGSSCVGKSAMYMGTVPEGPDINDALWSVACENGKNYLVKLFPGAAGETRTIACDELNAQSGIACFQKLQ
jgi:hypothetical protein